MKRNIIIFSVLLTLVLAACGSASNTPNPQAQGGPTSELPATTQLILGTLKLDATAQAVTAEQAAELLPLWQTMQVLSSSDTAAQQEKDALVEQIQETMSAKQMEAITAMNLNRADMMTVMQEQGPGVGGPTSGQNATSQNGNSSSNSGRNFGPSGGMPPPDGGFGGGPGFGAQGQNLSAEQIATAQAARQAGGGDMVPAPLLNAVIDYLQKKTAS